MNLNWCSSRACNFKCFFKAKEKRFTKTFLDKPNSAFALDFISFVGILFFSVKRLALSVVISNFWKAFSLSFLKFTLVLATPSREFEQN